MTVPSLRHARVTIVAAVAAAMLAFASPALAAPPPHANVKPDSPALTPHGPELFSPLQGLSTVEVL